MSIKSFLPADFKPPVGIETALFKLRMLTVNDLVKDYDAVMTSLDHLKGVFGPQVNWPYPELTLEQDLIDLGWHQKEFQINSSFAYTVFSLDESQCLGCTYIYPSEFPNFDAMAVAWVRSSELPTGLDQKLFITLKDWIQREWPFESVGYPGREHDWKDCNAMR